MTFPQENLKHISKYLTNILETANILVLLFKQNIVNQKISAMKKTTAQTATRHCGKNANAQSATFISKINTGAAADLRH